MKLTAYMRERGLIASLVATKIGVTRQYLDQYDAGKRSPTLKTMKRIAEAMTELGAPTTVADLSTALLTERDTEATGAEHFARVGSGEGAR